jgi:hypothetical protein
MKIRELLHNRVTDMLSMRLTEAQVAGTPLRTDDLAREVISFILETSARVAEDAAKTLTADIMDPAYKEACIHIAMDMRSLITPVGDAPPEFLTEMFARARTRHD